MSDPVTITQSGWRIEAFEGKPAICRHIDGSRITPAELLLELGEAAAQKKRWEEIEGGLKKCLMDYADEKSLTFIQPEASTWNATIITQNRKQQDLGEIQNRLHTVQSALSMEGSFDLLTDVISAGQKWDTTKFPWMAEEPYSIPQLVRFPRLDRKPRLAPGRAPKE